MDLVYSLLAMIRAHEESDTKSKRVRAVIHRQCKEWQDGTWRGVIRNGKDPSWTQLEPETKTFQLVPERAEAVKLAIRMFRNGHRAVRIMRTLAEEGLQFTNGGNPAGQLYLILHNRAPIGEYAASVLFISPVFNRPSASMRRSVPLLRLPAPLIGFFIAVSQSAKGSSPLDG